MNPMVIAAAAEAAPKIMDRMIPFYKTVFYTALAVGGGYFIYRQIKGSTKDPAGNNIGNLQINTAKLSYSPSEYSLMAQKLFLSMDRIGYNDTDIFSVLNAMRNRDDLLMLVKSFGIKRYGIVTSLFFGTDLNLFGWLSEELSSNDKVRAGAVIRALGVPF
jgi:hypothetical protein